MDAHFDAQESWSQAASDNVTDAKDLAAPMTIVHSGVGDVTLNDVVIASSAKASIVTYGVACDGKTIISAEVRSAVPVYAVVILFSL